MKKEKEKKVEKMNRGSRQFVCEKCIEKLPVYLKAIHQGNKYMFGKCKGKNHGKS